MKLHKTARYAQNNDGGYIMDNYNRDIACNVNSCRHNYGGCNCKLTKITVGCTCGDSCTCCESYDENV